MPDPSGVWASVGGPDEDVIVFIELPPGEKFAPMNLTYSGGGRLMPDLCILCGNEVDKNADDTFKEVVGWVGGHKRDSMTLRKNTGNYAHGDCIRAAKMSIPPTQPDIFSEEQEPQKDRPEDQLEF